MTPSWNEALSAVILKLWLKRWSSPRSADERCMGGALNLSALHDYPERSAGLLHLPAHAVGGSVRVQADAGTSVVDLSANQRRRLDLLLKPGLVPPARLKVQGS